mmetsp:Transcript_13928/g.16169  ORF Transcript_13928/g.16169 Transcript_13928/m.16169 type:complete len:104 (+) Transcript_13928:203-514(+)
MSIAVNAQSSLKLACMFRYFNSLNYINKEPFYILNQIPRALKKALLSGLRPRKFSSISNPSTLAPGSKMHLRYFIPNVGLITFPPLQLLNSSNREYANTSEYR